jgi:hypothetical protein
MTTFFDQKEEVLDLELTPYGETLVSLGKFKPEYYAFFDDDVLYDGGYADITESQNDIEPRIQTNTPQLKTQYLFSGLETNLSPQIEAIQALPREAMFGPLEGVDHDVPAWGLDVREEDYATFPPLIDQEYALAEPMGTMKIGSEHAPAWDIKVLQGELSGAINYLTASASGLEGNVKRIPQLDFNLNYKVVVGNVNYFDINGPISTRIISPVYDDGTFLYLTEDRPSLIFSIDELNAAEDTEYEIEVFLVQDGSELPNGESSGPVLKPLLFDKQVQQVVNGILLDAEDQDRRLRLGSRIDASYAEYFFQVNRDLGIAEEVICPLITDLRSRGERIDDIPYNCPDVEEVDRFDIYSSNITSADTEVCEDE